MINTPRFQHLALLFFLICLTLVLYAIFRPEPPQRLFYQSDKAGHILAFLSLGVSGRFAFPRLPALAFWLLLLAGSFSVEWLQHAFQPNRYFSYTDAAANAIGVMVAWVMVVVVKTWR